MGRETLKSFGAPNEITESLDDFRYELNHVYRVDDALCGYIERAFGSHPWRG